MYKNIFKNKIQTNRGFNIIELVIGIAVLVMMVGVIGLFARNAFYYNSVFSGGLTAYDDARHVLQPMSSEIRSMSPSSLGSYPIEIADDNSFVFFTDINDDGLKERIRYFIQGTTLKKGVIIPTGNPLVYTTANETFTELVHNLRNGATPVFTYYDTNYTGTTSPLTQPVNISFIRLIKVNMIVDVDPNRSPVPVTVTTQISVRNLKDNL